MIYAVVTSSIVIFLSGGVVGFSDGERGSIKVKSWSSLGGRAVNQCVGVSFGDKPKPHQRGRGVLPTG